MQSLYQPEGWKDPKDLILLKLLSSGVLDNQQGTPQDSMTTTPVTGQYADIINEASKLHGIDPQVIAAVIGQESMGNPNAKSPVGARGLMQLMPDTARMLGVRNIHDPYENIMGGTKYLKQQLDAFGGDLPKALGAYNAGPGAVRKYGTVPPYKETQNYVKKIMMNLQSKKENPPVPGPGDETKFAGYIPTNTPVPIEFLRKLLSKV